MNRDDYLKLCGQAQPQWSLLQTGDGGKTWKKVYTAFGDGFSTMQFFDQQTGFTTAGSQFPGDEGHLSVTRDGGRTWKQHTLLIPAPEGVDKESLFVSRPAFLNEKDGYLVATFTSQTKQVYYLYMTHDGGSTWQISGPALPNDAVDRFLDAQHIVVTINPGDGEVHMLLLTLQNGKWVTTVARPAGKDALMDGSFVSAQIGIALVATNRTIDVYKTDDGGQTWQKISTL
jgi:photosystem II stability/assembly factor-like uncharacterized protein